MKDTTTWEESESHGCQRFIVKILCGYRNEKKHESKSISRILIRWFSRRFPIIDNGTFGSSIDDVDEKGKLFLASCKCGERIYFCRIMVFWRDDETKKKNDFLVYIYPYKTLRYHYFIIISKNNLHCWHNNPPSSSTDLQYFFYIVHYD